VSPERLFLRRNQVCAAAALDATGKARTPKRGTKEFGALQYRSPQRTTGEPLQSREPDADLSGRKVTKDKPTRKP
jgi:hypothetical protein